MGRVVGAVVPSRLTDDRPPHTKPFDLGLCPDQEREGPREPETVNLFRLEALVVLLGTTRGSTRLRSQLNGCDSFYSYWPCLGDCVSIRVGSLDLLVDGYGLSSCV